MPARAKTLFLILLVLCSVLTLLFFLSKRLFLDSFNEIERMDLIKNVERARDIIGDEIRHISTINGDYSGWDDAYRFVQDGNPEFVRVNLDDAIYPKLRLNLLIYVNLAGEKVYAKAFDYQSGKEVPLPASLRDHLSPAASLLRHRTTESSVTGVIGLPEGLLLVASRPVLTSDYKGPIMGTLVMGRYLDDVEVARLARTTHLTLTVQRLDAASLPDDFGEARRNMAGQNSMYVRTRGSERISGYTPIKDIYGRDAFLIRVDGPRRIYHEGLKTVGYYFLWFLAIGLCTAVVFFFLIDRLVLTRQRKEESEERYRSVVERAVDGIVLVDPDSWVIREANKAFATLLGHSVAELIGKGLGDLLRCDAGEFREQSGRILGEKREMTFRHKDGTALYAMVSASRITHHDRAVLSLIIHDVTERKRFEEQLMYQATHDPLTGLPNRNLLNDRLELALAAARRSRSAVALMLIDLDHFKLVNDTRGHGAGDQLLAAVAQRLTKSVRAADTLARLGGDEFVILFSTVRQREEMMIVAEHFHGLFAAPFAIRDQDIFISASMGMSLFPDDGENGEILLKRADTALYHAKAQGRNGFQFFADEMNTILNDRLAIESHLRHAIGRQELFLVYQPMIEAASGRIVGVEALLRWDNPELGPVHPSRFIRVAEDSGLILAIGEWVLRTACLQQLRWLAEGLPPLRIAVNLSPRQFAQGNLVGMVREVLDETGFDPRSLELELTESLMMRNIEDSIEKMTALKELGVRFSIDDFGTGYSSLSYLQRFPLDRLKIDKSFVSGVPSGKHESSIVRAIVAMAHSLNLTVVAEGVETADQLGFLREHGCNEIQGYYFSPPLTEREFGALMAMSVVPGKIPPMTRDEERSTVTCRRSDLISREIPCNCNRV